MESIKEKPQKSKLLADRTLFWFQRPAVFWPLAVVLAILIILGSIKLNRLAGYKRPITVLENAFEPNLSGKMGSFVASRVGKVYYFWWCGVAHRIKDANLVWFKNRALAEQKGYIPASNCHGLK